MASFLKTTPIIIRRKSGSRESIQQKHPRWIASYLTHSKPGRNSPINFYPKGSKDTKPYLFEFFVSSW
jgi:hypothetical protein